MNLAINSLISHRNTIYTKEEVPEVGCCFNVFEKNYQSQSQLHKPIVHRYSQPKRKPGKKIDLLISRNNLTLPKPQLNSSRPYSVKSQSNQIQLKTMENTAVITSLASKTTTQINSLKNSRTRLNLQSKTTIPSGINRYQKYISICNEGRNKPVQIIFQQTKPQISNIQYLSQISIVQQQFLSRGSATLNALNFLVNHHSEPKLSATPVRYMIDAVNEKRLDSIRQTPNPLQRMLQKKGVRPQQQRLRPHQQQRLRPQQRQRLHL